MKINVNKKDIINMIAGYQPDESWNEFLKENSFAVFPCEGGICWNLCKLSMYNKKTLFAFYHELKSKCTKSVPDSDFAWRKATYLSLEHYIKYFNNMYLYFDNK